MPYQTPHNIDPNKIFLINFSEIEGKLNPEQYHIERINAIDKIKGTGHYMPLSSIVSFKKEITTIIKQGDIYVGLENISSGYGEYIETTEKQSISSAAIFEKGDILFPKLRPYLNKVFFATFDGICSTEFYVLRSNMINAEYLSIFLRSAFVVNQTKHLMTGNTLPRLQTEDVRDLLIPIPPKDTQQKIIDCNTSAYNKRREKMQYAYLLLKGIDNYLLGEFNIQLQVTEHDLNHRILVLNSNSLESRLDPIFYNTDIRRFTHCTYSERLSDIAFSFVPGFSVGRQDQVEEDDGIIQIRPTNIDNNGRLKYDKNVYVAEMKDVPFVESGVVLFNNTNSQEWVGKTAYFANEEKRKVYISNHITAIEVDRSKILPEYLCAILNMYQRHKVFYSICTNWNNQSGIGLDLLKSLHIPLFTDDRKESLHRQQQIVDRINTIYQEADECILSANQIINEAKAKVESMIIGE